MMKALHLLLFTYITVALAGGYAGCLEKIWLYKAYEIDSLNPAGQRRIGFKCTTWDQTSKTCTNNNWVQCAGSAAGGACSYDEFINFLDEPAASFNWAVPPTGDMDIVETAKRCMANNKNKIPNHPAYHAMQNTLEYNDLINKVSTVVDDTWKAGRYTNNIRLWEQFDDIRNHIIIARTGDHGKWLLKKALKELPNNIVLEKRDLGTNPMTGNQWQTADWQKTALTAQNAGVSDAEKTIKDFLQDFYGDRKESPRKHLVVIQSYKRTKDKTTSCRMRAA